MSAESITCCQLDICSCFPGLQAQSTSCKKEHTCSSDRGKTQSGRDSWERTRFIVDSKKTQSEEESPARILPVCTSHPHTQTCRYPPLTVTMINTDTVFCLLPFTGTSLCLWTWFRGFSRDPEQVFVFRVQTLLLLVDRSYEIVIFCYSVVTLYPCVYCLVIDHKIANLDQRTHFL